jgi:hypothetical protein
MYTDGLIERKGERLDEGMARLEAHAVRLVGDGSTDFGRDLLEAVAAHSTPTDDVVIVAVRFEPQN